MDRDKSKGPRTSGRQGLFAFPNGWGGRRKGAGRKPGPNPGIPHARREELSSRHPVLVTIPVEKGLPRLRRTAERKTLERAFRAGRERFGFRLTEYSIQADHLHLVVEAEDRRALSRGMQGLSIRVAKALNRLWSRKGSVLADRYHARILRSPRDVRNALAYVLQNARKHGRRLRQGFVDGFSSARWFGGWRGMRALARGPLAPVAQACTWLLLVGWRRHGLIDPDEIPRGAAR